MGLQKTAVGIDFGVDSIKAVRVRVSGTEASVESCVSISRAEFADGAAGPEGIEEAAHALREAMQAEGMPTKGVVLSIDARESIIRYNQVPNMPASRLALLMKYEVESIGERMGEQLASDFRVLPTVRDDGEQTALLALAKEELLGEFLDALERAGITVAAAVPAPLALFGAWDLFATKADLDAPEDDLVVAVDLGRSGLNVVLILNNRLVFARSGSLGGEVFTEALVKEFDISRDDAERLKLAKGGVDERISAIDDRTVGPLRGAAGQLLGFVQSSVRFGSSQTGVRLPSVTRLWLTGGGMRLRGLAAYLGSGMGHAKVETFDPTGESAAEGGAVRAGEASVGMPLGLSAVGLLAARDAASAAGLSILPEKYEKRRTFRERTRWLYAAAALLLVLVVARGVQGWREKSHSQGIVDTFTELRSDLDSKRSQRDGWNANSSRTRARNHRLLREAEVSPFQEFMLDFLSRNLRAEIQIESMELDVEPTENEDTGAVDNEYRLLIRGRVNNEKRRAHEWVLDLESKIRQEERVRSARIQTASDDRGTWYSFELLVEPRYVSI